MNDISKRLRTKGLIVAATKLEIQPILDGALQVRKQESEECYTVTYPERQWDVLITGVGATYMAFRLGQQLLYRRKYRLVLNVGIAGAWDKSFIIGDLCEVEEECFGDLGVHTKDGFLNIHELGLDVNDEDYEMDPTAPIPGVLINPYASSGSKIPLSKKKQNTYINKYAAPPEHIFHPTLPLVKGLTVNTVHGDEVGIQKTYDYWSKRGYPMQVETMEGAGFFLTCMADPDIVFHQYRAISNYVEPRDTSRWNIPLAVENLNKFLIEHYFTEEEKVKAPEPEKKGKPGRKKKEPPRNYPKSSVEIPNM